MARARVGTDRLIGCAPRMRSGGGSRGNQHHGHPALETHDISAVGNFHAVGVDVHRRCFHIDRLFGNDLAAARMSSTASLSSASYPFVEVTTIWLVSVSSSVLLL